MHSLTGQLAAVMASTDAVPRLIRQYDALFLVTPKGDVWRVFDSDDPSGEPRYSPSSAPTAATRVFIGSGSAPTVRLYAFRNAESSALSAEILYQQLLASPDPSMS